ncbi:MAG: hypothetical protein KAI91_07865 [Candidatus Omnitrophica bacterium]|nr:hypothetical protein [Candidatus Omnitrophota bacterium]MCK5394241.1 hypothetical protein [Candidatus Omnitrophota bacterium]
MCIKSLNEKVKKLSFIDLKLAEYGIILGTIIIVKIFPQLLKINIGVLLILALVFLVKPLYSFWIKQ